MENTLPKQLVKIKNQHKQNMRTLWLYAVEVVRTKKALSNLVTSLWWKQISGKVTNDRRIEEELKS